MTGVCCPVLDIDRGLGVDKDLKRLNISTVSSDNESCLPILSPKHKLVRRRFRWINPRDHIDIGALVEGLLQGRNISIIQQVNEVVEGVISHDCAQDSAVYR